MAAPISNASNLNNKEIRVPAIEEYINANPLRPWMGANDNAIIQTLVDTTKGRGDTMYFALREAFDPDNAVTGTSQLEGQEEDLVFREDSVTLDYVRFAGKVEQHLLTDIRTPLETLAALRPSIIDAHAQRFRNDIIDAAALTASPVRNRVLFGAADSNYNATLATALANVDSSADKMSVDVIRIAKKKAQNVGVYSNGTTNRKIRPYRFVGPKGETTQEHYVLFLDPVAAQHLKQDTEFQELRDNFHVDQLAMPYFNGSRILGMVDGVLCVEIEEMTRIDHDTAGAGSDRVAHNLLCGAQAFGIGIGEPGVFAERSIDYDFHRGVAMTVIRGLTVLKFSDGSNDVENGLVHVYTTGVV